MESDPVPERPKPRVSDLAEWPHTGYEPETPEIHVQHRGINQWRITLDLHDQITAEWLAHWMSRKPRAGGGSFWEAFGDWLDSRT